ncbi:MAG: nucleotidyltransferase domain-containing protein [Candidatus Woesearchaeota archaeon]
MKDINKKKIRFILKSNGVVRAGIFGSYARGEQRKNSDVDILIQPPKGIGFGLGGIKVELEETLKKKVHLVTYKYIHPRLNSDFRKSVFRHNSFSLLN